MNNIKNEVKIEIKPPKEFLKQEDILVSKDDILAF